MTDLLFNIYNKLYDKYGPQQWWPGDSPWEIAVGAVLTQNTNWRNVEKAIDNMKKAGLINNLPDKTANSAEKLLNTPSCIIEKEIRPSGYYRMKTKTLKNFAVWWKNNVTGTGKLNNMNLKEIRGSLLTVNGIGPETADSILLYAFDLPTFVIDAYTKRIMSRHAGTNPDIKYETLRALFMNALPEKTELFNEFHALFVRLAKESCLKKECTKSCILRELR
jgi:endonuclease-3 related protein